MTTSTTGIISVDWNRLALDHFKNSSEKIRILKKSDGNQWYLHLLISGIKEVQLLAYASNGKYVQILLLMLSNRIMPQVILLTAVRQMDLTGDVSTLLHNKWYKWYILK